MVKCNHALYWSNYENPVDAYDPDLHHKGWAMISWVSMHNKSLASFPRPGFSTFITSASCRLGRRCNLVRPRCW
ncbi:MAG: hypothetical protein SWK76_10560 [Actinomycetota bacterium]|nr:hypothetical protein [Actinomycetota bacterium]